jgi:hypothetical protein
MTVLGLGGEWDEYLRQAEEAPDEDEFEDNEEHPPPPDYAGEVLERVEGLPLCPVDGNPVSLPMVELARTGFAAEACSTWPSPMMAITVSLPEGKDVPELPDNCHGHIDVAPTDRGFRIGLLNRMWFRRTDLETSLSPTLLNTLLNPDDGTDVDVAFVVADEPPTCQRFRGTVRKGKWWIDQTYPRLSSDALAGLIAISAYENESRLVCCDAAEAVALVHAARRNPHLCNMDVKCEEAVVSAVFASGDLAKLLLRHRYPDVWDFGPAQKHEAEEYEEARIQKRESRRAGVEAARRRAISHDRDVLYKGRHSWYFRADIGALDQLDPEPRQRFDDTMVSMGFHAVGDLVAKKQRDILLHVFAGGDHLVYGVLMAKRTMYLGYEFVSRLADNSLLTTTTNGSVESCPAAGIYYRSFPGLMPEALHAKHHEGLERFRRHKHVTPVELDPALVGVAQEIEIAFERQQAADSS